MDVLVFILSISFVLIPIDGQRIVSNIDVSTTPFKTWESCMDKGWELLRPTITVFENQGYKVVDKTIICNAARVDSNIKFYNQ